MKTKSAIICGLTALTCATHAVVSLDFTNFAPDTVGSQTNIYSDQGDVWRASDVRIGAGTQFDALFTFIDSDGLSTANLEFADESARGDDARVRMNKLTTDTASATIQVTFVQADTLTPFAFGASEEMVVQYDDLDSDFDKNRSDFAGILTSQIQDSELATNTELEFSTSLVPTYTVAVLDEPWTPQVNISSTAPVDQSPVTAAYSIVAGGFNMVVGVTGPDTGNRHVDIDMTPDFTIIPEPSLFSFLVGGFAIAGVLLRRRR